MSHFGLFISICICIAVLLSFSAALDNGVARTPPMGWSTWNLYHRDFTEQVFYDAVDIMSNTSLKSVGYEYINVDGGWWYSYNNTVMRNDSGYAYYSPTKYPESHGGIQQVIQYIHSHGFKYGHYTDAGTAACDGDTQMSEYFMDQDVALFTEWKMDMIKVDACHVEGNDTAIIYKWRKMLNETGQSVLFSNCHNQCVNDPTGQQTWEPWCVGLANMWRVSKDIQPHWANMVHNIDCTKGLGKYAQPGAWNDPDFLEVDIGEFGYDGTVHSINMNRAHFSLWCIISAPLILGNNLSNMTTAIQNIVANKEAIAVNQNYLNSAGDVITEFAISSAFRTEYEQQRIKNMNMTDLFYKPLPAAVAAAAFVFLNRDVSSSSNAATFNVSVDFTQLPGIGGNGVDPLFCDAYNVWTKETHRVSTFAAMLDPQSAQFIRLSKCSSQPPPFFK